jgi:hypothetical protein
VTLWSAYKKEKEIQKEKMAEEKGNTLKITITINKTT